MSVSQTLAARKGLGNLFCFLEAAALAILRSVGFIDGEEFGALLLFSIITEPKNIILFLFKKKIFISNMGNDKQFPS